MLTDFVNVPSISYAVGSVLVRQEEPLLVSAGPDHSIMQGDHMRLQASFDGGRPPLVFQWIPADGLDDSYVLQPTAAPDRTTAYTLSITDSLGSVVSDGVVVNVAEQFLVTAISDQTIRRGEVATLGVEILGGVRPYTFLWSPDTDVDDPTSEQPTVAPRATTTYRVTVTDAEGRVEGDEITVSVVGPPQPPGPCGTGVAMMLPFGLFFLALGKLTNARRLRRDALATRDQ